MIFSLTIITYSSSVIRTLMRLLTKGISFIRHSRLLVLWLLATTTGNERSHRQRIGSRKSNGGCISIGYEIWIISERGHRHLHVLVAGLCYPLRSELNFDEIFSRQSTTTDDMLNRFFFRNVRAWSGDFNEFFLRKLGWRLRNIQIYHQRKLRKYALSNKLYI